MNSVYKQNHIIFFFICSELSGYDTYFNCKAFELSYTVYIYKVENNKEYYLIVDFSKINL